MTQNFRKARRSNALDARDVEELGKKLSELRVEIQDLRESRRRILLDADADRRTIERDLHNGVQQHLTALAMKVQLGRETAEHDPSVRPALLEEIARDVQEAIDEAAHLAQRIHPPRLDTGSLPAALRSWAVSAGVRASIEVQLSSDDPPETAEMAYFCCLEALEQLEASAHVTITVRDGDGLVLFDIVSQSDGVASPRSDAAFDRLRDRVNALDGDLVIRSESGAGTRVSGSIRPSR